LKPGSKGRPRRSWNSPDSQELSDWMSQPILCRRDLFTDFDDEPSYGVALRGARGKEGLTQKELAQKTGIPQSHISSMENGRMTIGRERARRLAKVLRVDYRIFL
jgi:ribosome-binding protein aMBF1 (putative translation factor)